MSKNVLDNLFGSRLRVKILKFLFRNYPSEFSVREVRERTQEPISAVKHEIENLVAIGLLRKKGK